MMAQPTIRFSVIGINHNHIYGQVNLLLRAGAELVDFFAVEHDLAADFARAYPRPDRPPAPRRSWKTHLFS